MTTEPPWVVEERQVQVQGQPARVYTGGDGVHALLSTGRSPIANQARRAVEVLRRQTDHMARLVDELVDVTGISRGKIEPGLARADLRELVRRTCDDHQSIFDAAGVSLSLAVPARRGWVDADATRISQATGNLLQNAAKFTRARGKVAVTVEARDGRAVVRVQDDGIRMEADLLPRVFEPFVQGEHGMARGRAAAWAWHS